MLELVRNIIAVLENSTIPYEKKLTALSVAETLYGAHIKHDWEKEFQSLAIGGKA